MIIPLIFMVFKLVLNEPVIPAVQPFEGVVEYKISYPNQRKAIDEMVVAQCRIFYKAGNIRKEYLNKHDSLLLYTIYSHKENIHYAIIHGKDTVEYYIPSPENLLQEFSNVDSVHSQSFYDEEGLLPGFNCKKYTVTFKYDDAPLGEDPMTYQYWVSGIGNQTSLN